MFRMMNPHVVFFIAVLLQRNDCRPTLTDEPHHSGKSLDFFNKGLKYVPENLDSDTEYLILNQNQITSLANLEKCPELLYVTLSDNLLTTNDDLRGIRSVKKLQFLDLSFNGLLTFNLNTLQQNNRLQALVLDGNRDLMIDGGIPSLPHLQNVSLLNCSLTSMPWTDFRPVPRLKFLNLRGNSIKEIPEDAVRSLPDLVELMVDDELCPILANRADVKEKQVKLICTMTNSVSKERPEDAVTEGKYVDGGVSDKMGNDYIIWFIGALIVIVLCAATVAILMVNRKKGERSLNVGEEDNEISRINDHRWVFRPFSKM